MYDNTLEQRSVRRLLQISFGFENQRPIDHFFWIHEFAYTFAYTSTLTTRRAPVYKGLSWVSALITREPKQGLKVTKRRLLRLKVRFGHLSFTLSNAGGARKCVGKYCTLSMAMLLDAKVCQWRNGLLVNCGVAGFRWRSSLENWAIWTWIRPLLIGFMNRDSTDSDEAQRLLFILK